MRPIGKPIGEKQVRDFETLVGLALPASYRNFLLQHNGGRPVPDAVDIPDLPGGGTDVSVIFGLDTFYPVCNLDSNRTAYAEQIPPGFLPIARDSGGGVFCIALGSAGSGEVYFVDTPGDICPVYPVAASFDLFLEILREFVE